MNKKAFTLIELLVVVAIIAILVAFAIANFVGARQRARDLRKKAELQQMKSALRLYYNDFSVYPGPTNAGVNEIEGCGTATPPSASCYSTCGNQFAVGGSGCSTVYMKQLPAVEDYEWHYQSVSSGDDFCLWTMLENESDTEITKSQARCAAPCLTLLGATDYVVCAD